MSESFKSIRSFVPALAVLLTATIGIGGGIGFLFWSGKRSAEGVSRGSALAADMPEMLNAFPAYEPCGEITQRFEPRDGERAPASRISYSSTLAPAELLGRYASDLNARGCDVKPGNTTQSLILSCPGLFDFGITVSDGSACRPVDAAWFGGKE
ncbi:hypothetical protein ABIC89_002721 [Variovorax boronicumulans]|uniref:hypothetical protein n=1 Tax=Variovorax boronicumulans TaxID=436515 RepID=UPI00339A26E3